MDINLTISEWETIIDALSAAMPTVLAQRENLSNSGLFAYADGLTDLYKRMNNVRYKIEKALDSE